MAKILAIDDKHDNFVVISALLKNLIPGCQVLTALSGAEGMEKAKAESPDVILLDMAMANMDGYEVCKRFKNDEGTASIPVIMLTAARTDSKSRIKGLELGADAFLAKPVDEAELVAQVKVAFRIKEAEDRLRKEKDLLEETVAKRTEELRKSEEKFRLLTAMAPVGIYQADENRDCIYVNERWCEMAGLSPEEAAGKGWVKGLHPEDRDRVTSGWYKMKESDGKWGIEYRFQTPSGETTWVCGNAKPIKDEQGRITGYMGTNADITKIKRAEEDLLLFRKLINQSNDPVFVIDPETARFLDVNEKSCRSLGYAREELLNMKVLDIEEIMPGHFSWETHVEEVRNKSYMILETVHKRRDGSTIPVETNVKLITHGKKEYLVAVVRDLTERKRAEESIRESEERYRAMFENMSDGVAVYKAVNDGEDFVIMDFNKAGENIEKIKKEALIGKSVCEVFAGVKDFGLFDVFQRVWITGAPEHYPLAMYKDERIAGWRDNSVYKLPSGEIVAVYRDETERKQAEEEKNRLMEQLRQAQKMEAIGTLAGGIAHDFNNILAAVFGFTELAMEHLEQGSSLQHWLQEVLAAAKRAKDLVQQILIFSRQSEYALMPVSVKLVTKEALKLLRASLPTTIEIRPNIQCDSLVMSDPTQIHQIMMNLCTNAGHAMQENGGVLNVDLENVALDSEFAAGHSGLKPGPYVKLTVSDTGYGMSREVMDRIFDPFYTTKEKGEGTGMGLSVVHGIVKSCKGIINVYSESGKGSTFKVFLPAIERRLEPEIRIEKPAPQGTERILYVDDEQALVKMGKQILESLGYDVTTRTSSIEALQLFKARPESFDLVITDMTMPNMTGDELARGLIAVRPDIPIILCTGFSMRITEAEAKNMGVRAFVMKPLLKKDIAETIRKVMDER